MFTGSTVIEICLKHVREAREPPGARLGRPVTPALEALLLRCLAKARADRPGDAGAMLHELDRCPVAGMWTADDDDAWWATFAHTPPAASFPPSPAVTTDQVPLDVTLAYEARS